MQVRDNYEVPTVPLVLLEAHRGATLSKQSSTTVLERLLIAYIARYKELKENKYVVSYHSVSPSKSVAIESKALVKKCNDFSLCL
jgi:hypothetical protein